MTSINAQQFIDQYAETLSKGSAELAAGFHLVPSVFMGDHSKQVLQNKNELEKILTSILSRCTEAGIVLYQAEVNQTMRLSDSLFFTTMRWNLYDADNQLRISFTASYTMQELEDGNLKIIVTVVDDDKKQLEGIFPVWSKEA